MGSPDRRGRRHGWSAKTRIVGWLLLLVTIALAANLLIATRVLLARSDHRLDDELQHEFEKLSTFVQQSGSSYRRVDALLDAYLSTALPEDEETYFTVVDGRPDRRSTNEPPARLDLDEAFVQTTNAVDGPDLGRWDSDAGDVRYGVFPVSVPRDERQAYLVVAEFAAAEQAQTTSVLRILVAVSAGALAVAGIVSWLVAGRLLRPIQTVSETAEQISESDLTRRIAISGDDDVADLARTFNRMLDRIEAAFDGQRRFLDDAGHELRTPLTIVRGHLEVMGDEPQERRQMMPLVLDELARMGRIVDDLLMLARAERADFLTLGPVDLADLTVEVVAKARTLGDRRWTVSDVAEVVVTADGQRLTQALMQLVTNAVSHTSDGDTIDVGSAIGDGDVMLWVGDSGSGIAHTDIDRIFERFVSMAADGDTGSTGLGLAIVKSIAEAHSGQVLVASQPGAGSRFTLVLPVPVIDAGVGGSVDADHMPSQAVAPAHADETRSRA